MHSSEEKPKPQVDEHAVSMVPELESQTLPGLDWDQLIARGQTPSLPLGAERRNEPRK